MGPISVAGVRPTVTWTGEAIEIIDQTLLPAEERVLVLRTPDEVVDAIQRLAVRGAPAIGVAGALGVLLCGGDDAAAERIASARPTAVNLRWGVERVLAAADRKAEALAILAEDIASCRAIGEHGHAELGNARRFLTVCNAGRLATAGMGTALAPIYVKAEAGEAVEVFACETRPLLQGARLTAWELARRRHPGDRAPRRRGAFAAGERARGRRDRRLRPGRGQRRRGQQDRHLRAGDRRPPSRCAVLRRRTVLDARLGHAERAPRSRSSSATGERCARWPASTRGPRSGTLPST